MLAVACALVAGIGSYQVAIRVSPATRIFEGRVVRIMPIGQVLVGVVVAAVAFIAIFFLSRRRRL